MRVHAYADEEAELVEGQLLVLREDVVGQLDSSEKADCCRMSSIEPSARRTMLPAYRILARAP